MIKSKIRLTAVALTFVITVSSSACSPNTSTVGPQVVSGTPAAKTEYKYGKIDPLGKDGAFCGAPIYTAYDRGFFTGEDFDVALISAGIETRKIGLNNGTIPLVNGDFQFFPSTEEGVQVKVVDGPHNGCTGFVVPKDSKITGVNNLKGKKIAVDEIGGTPHQVVSVWLEKTGIFAKQEDGEVTSVPYTDGNLELEAAKKGDVDVAALWDLLGSIAEGSGDYRAVFDLSKDPIFAGKYYCFLYASSKVLKEDPEKVSTLLRAIRKAQGWISKNPKEAVDIISDKKYPAIEDKELAEKLTTSYEYPSTENCKADPEHVRENVLYFVQQLKNIGYLKTNNPDVFADQIFEEVDVTSGTQKDFCWEVILQASFL